MAKKPFKADQFTATEFDTAEDKAKFANHFVRFIEGGYEKTLFHKKFYQRLSNCFFHIAHYNQGGFYETWFETEEDRMRFLEHTVSHHAVGSQEYTYCDVERAIQQYLKDSPDIMDKQFKRHKEAQRQSDKSTAIGALQRLGPQDRNDILKTIK